MTVSVAASESYTLLDEIWARATDAITHAPYWVLLLITAFLFAIFVYGLVKKLIVFSVLVGILIALICGIWFVAGHAVT